MIKHCLFAILCFWSLNCYSEPPTFHSLKPTPLQFYKIGEHEVAYFKGQVQLVGNFEAEWRYLDEEPSELIVSFYPTPESAALLPFPVGEEAPTLIVFSNAEEAAEKLLSKTNYEKLMDTKPFEPIKGAAIVTISEYNTAIECDSRWYEARLLSVEPLNDNLSAYSLGNLPC